MAKIEAPNKEYTGTVQGAAFLNGVAYVPGDAVNLAWFRRKGYKVTADGRDSEAVHEQMKADPPEEEGGAQSQPIEDGGETAAWTDEMRRKAHGEGVGHMLPPGVGSPSSAPVIGPGMVASQRQLDNQANVAKKAGRKSTRKSSAKKTSRRKTTRRKSPRKSSRAPKSEG